MPRVRVVVTIEKKGAIFSAGSSPPASALFRKTDSTAVLIQFRASGPAVSIAARVGRIMSTPCPVSSVQAADASLFPAPSGPTAWSWYRESFIESAFAKGEDRASVARRGKANNFMTIIRKVTEGSLFGKRRNRRFGCVNTQRLRRHDLGQRMKPLCPGARSPAFAIRNGEDKGKVPASDAGECDDHRKVDVREFPVRTRAKAVKLTRSMASDKTTQTTELIFPTPKEKI